MKYDEAANERNNKLSGTRNGSTMEEYKEAENEIGKIQNKRRNNQFHNEYKEAIEQKDTAKLNFQCLLTKRMIEKTTKKTRKIFKLENASKLEKNMQEI